MHTLFISGYICDIITATLSTLAVLMAKYCTHNRRLNKLFYYAKSFLHQKLYPRQLKLRHKKSCFKLLNDTQIAQRVFQRVNYYCKINQYFELVEQPSIPECQHTLYLCHSNNVTSLNCGSFYRFDCQRYLSHFPSHYQLHLLPGDIVQVPSFCSAVKSRPISQDSSNDNACLLKLDALRHFNFIQDTLTFNRKIPQLVWRGAAHQPHRKAFLQQFYDHPLMNVGQVNQPDCRTYQPKMSISEQLDYQFILSIEGNDVATNLKWIMSSQSLCFMTKPKYETWFMEGTLVAGFHYVEVKDDYSDLVDKMKYYTDYPDEAKIIIQQANAYCQEFMDNQKEDLIHFLVLEKFFHFSRQIKSDYAEHFSC